MKQIKLFKIFALFTLLKGAKLIPLLRYINQKDLTKVFKKYSDFPKYFIPGAFINKIGCEIPIFVLSTFFSTSIAGYYALAYRVLTLPISLISNSINEPGLTR